MHLQESNPKDCGWDTAMLGRSKAKPITEHAADGQVERIYHEIRQTLRVTGVNLVFRSWARHEAFFEVMWEDVRQSAETLVFEECADHLRADAVRAANALGGLCVLPAVQLGESQLFQLRAALDLYHYINPKLLLLVSAVRMALDGEPVGERPCPSPLDQQEAPKASEARISLGAPPRMAAMEMVSEKPDDEALTALFDDIKKTLSLPAINSDYRTLALWPDYLTSAWKQLKPVVQSDRFQRASEVLRQASHALAKTLPHPIYLGRERLKKSLLRTRHGER